MARAYVAVAAISVLPWLSGCIAAGVEPRSADLAACGRVGASGTFSVIGLAPSVAQVQREDGSLSENDEIIAMRGAVHPLAVIGSMLYNTQAKLRVGVHPRFELAADLGWQQLGGEARAGVLDEDAGDALSLAVSGGIAWRPHMDVAAPWGQLGVQVSRRFDGLTPLANFYATLGPETHAMFLDEHLDRGCGGFGEEGCGEFAAPRHLLFHRNELRLHLPLGFSYTMDDGRYDSDASFDEFFKDDPASRSLHHSVPSGPIITFAITPYVIAWSADVAAAECVGCGFITPLSVNARFGGTLTLGIRSLDWH